MENFCQTGNLEHKDGYDVCRDVKKMTLPSGILRYDLTLIYPKKQTKGHYHVNDEPELYEVISGIANFLIQNRDASQTYMVEAQEKDNVIIPIGFSMRTINPSDDKILIISNWIKDDVKNDYNAFKNLQKPIRLKPKKILQELENLDFLLNPQKYKDFLTVENLYDKIDF